MKLKIPSAQVVVKARGSWQALEPLKGHGRIASTLQAARATSSVPRRVPVMDRDSPLATADTTFTLRVDSDQADAVAKSMAEHPLVDSAYVVHPAPMGGLFMRDGLAASQPSLTTAMPPLPPPPAAVSPNLSSQQLHLISNQGGVEAEAVWQLPGGRGTGVTILDIEYAWDLSHEDLSQTVLEMPGSRMCEPREEDSDHGTAVLGLLGAIHDQKGTRGICPDADVRVFSHCPAGYVANAIESALPALRQGDIILVEAQNFAPFEPVPTSRLVPVEWWLQEWSAIRRAVNAGIIVVCCAANGNLDLDEPTFDQPLDPSWLQQGWENPFRRTARSDSGSILVGAGVPRFAASASMPEGSRCRESNFGSCVDTQQWGLETVTCGYGQPDTLNLGPTRRYTQFFGGTSGAGALVAGMLACVQGMLKAQGLRPLNGAEAREILRSVGTPQASSALRPNTQRIGSRATVREVHAAALVMR